MLNIKNYLLFLVSFLFLSVGNAALEKSNVDSSFKFTDRIKINVDSLFKTADFVKIIGTDKVLNLMAQMSNPKATTPNINELNEFIVLSTVQPDYYTVIASFDKDQKIIKKVTYDEPWLGVSYLSQNELPSLTLQDGLQLANACMLNKGQQIPDQVARVVIYKTINTQQIIYDYVLRNPKAKPGVCEEVLYSPATGECQNGLRPRCHYDVENPLIKQ